MPRSEVREILPSSLWPVLCSAQPAHSHGTAAWEIEHYESNVESFSGERATAVIEGQGNACVRSAFRENYHRVNLSVYRTLAIITRGFYYFSIFSHVGVSLMFGSVTMTLGGYKTRAVIIRARLMITFVRFDNKESACSAIVAVNR